MDVTLELDVEVTQHDIDHGERRDCRECPGALAINRALDKALGEGRYVASVGGNVYVWKVIGKADNGKPITAYMAYWTAGLPKELSQLVTRVDWRLEEPQPVSFHLTLRALKEDLS